MFVCFMKEEDCITFQMQCIEIRRWWCILRLRSHFPSNILSIISTFHSICWFLCSAMQLFPSSPMAIAMSVMSHVSNTGRLFSIKSHYVRFSFGFYARAYIKIDDERKVRIVVLCFPSFFSPFKLKTRIKRAATTAGEERRKRRKRKWHRNRFIHCYFFLFLLFSFNKCCTKTVKQTHSHIECTEETHSGILL